MDCGVHQSCSKVVDPNSLTLSALEYHFRPEEARGKITMAFAQYDVAKYTCNISTLIKEGLILTD